MDNPKQPEPLSAPKFTLAQMQASLDVLVGAAKGAHIPWGAHAEVGAHAQGLREGLENWWTFLQEAAKVKVDLALSQQKDVH